MDEANVETKGSSRINTQKQISKLVISSMMLALAVAVEYISKCIPFFKWPMGGSISIVMIPLILVGLYCGPFYGFFISIAYSVINFFIDGVTGWTPNMQAVLLSLLLDYIIGFGACGLSSIFRKQFFEKKAWAPIVAILICGFTRLLASFLSGMIVFTQAFDYESKSGLAMDFTWGGFTYSLSYNAGYMIPSIVLCIALMFALLKPLYTTFNTNIIRPLAKEVNTTPSFDITTSKFIVPINLVIAYGFGILSTIPLLKMYYLGYFGIIISLSLSIYEFCAMLKDKKNEQPFDIYKSLYLTLAVFGLALSIFGVVSLWTYGYTAYNVK